MKKSEKKKGKERAAAIKQKTLLFAIAGAAICMVAAIALFLVLSPAVVKAGDTVSVFYIGMLDNGTVFDSNVNTTPLAFTVGTHVVIPGFEDAVIGMSKNQVKTVHIPMEKAYGPYRSDLVRVVNRSLFPADITPEAGIYYSVGSITGDTSSIVKVVSVTRDTVTIDQNHMLAGQNLTFTIRLAGFTTAK
jgi:peptidylprolyl isomerase